MKLILKSAKRSTDSTFTKFYVKVVLQAHPNMHENDNFEVDLLIEHYNVIG